MLHYFFVFSNIFVLCYSSGVDEKCYVLPTSTWGQCSPPSQCPLVKALEKENVNLTVCEYQRKYDQVCCPNFENATGVGLLAKRKCYAQESKRVYIPIPPDALIGGVPALSTEFRHMAALGYGELDKIDWRCGGSLISEKFVLTAAHCVTTRDLGNVKIVRMGDLNLYTTTDEADPQDVLVKRIIRHPDYTASSRYNDIALLELEKPVRITEYVNPICLQTTFSLPPEFGKPISTGWGDTQFGGDRSAHLLKADLDYYSVEKCNKSFSNVAKRQLRDGIVEEKQICAGGIDVVKDTCQGDSGGPLQARNEYSLGPYYLIGITSFGIGCGIINIPGVYTRVSHYISWIEENVWPNQ